MHLKRVERQLGKIILLLLRITLRTTVVRSNTDSIKENMLDFFSTLSNEKNYGWREKRSKFGRHHASSQYASVVGKHPSPNLLTEKANETYPATNAKSRKQLFTLKRLDSQWSSEIFSIGSRCWQTEAKTMHRRHSWTRPWITSVNYIA